MEVQDFTLLKQVLPRKLTPKELETIGNSIPGSQTSSISKLQGQLLQINTNYPHSMPLYLKIVIACLCTLAAIIILLMGYRCHKYGCVKGILVPLLCRKQKSLMRAPAQGDPASAKFISDMDHLKWQTAAQPRSSVMIQEVELQPMISQNTSRMTPPAIQAPGVSSLRVLPKDTIRTTPDTVAKALETTAGLNFDCYYKKKQSRTGRRMLPKT